MAERRVCVPCSQDATDLSDVGADFLLGLLTPSEKQRAGCGRGGFASSVQAHPWFGCIDWVALLRQQMVAPWTPPQVTATDRRGSHAPTSEEIRHEVKALFHPKTGVLRERPFNPSQWKHLFEPFGITVDRVIKPPPPSPPSGGSSNAPDPTASKDAASSSTPSSVTDRSAPASNASAAEDAKADHDERTETMSSAASSAANIADEGSAV